MNWCDKIIKGKKLPKKRITVLYYKKPKSIIWKKFDDYGCIQQMQDARRSLYEEGYDTKIKEKIK